MGGFVVRLVILCLCVGMVGALFTRSSGCGAVSLMFLNLMLCHISLMHHDSDRKSVV